LWSDFKRMFLNIKLVLWSKESKSRGPIWLVIGAQFKSLHLCLYRGALVPLELATCRSEKATLVPSKRRFQGGTCIFQPDDAKLHTECITTAWLHSRRIQVLDWPACGPYVSPTEKDWHITAFCFYLHLQCRSLRGVGVAQFRVRVRMKRETFFLWNWVKV